MATGWRDRARAYKVLVDGRESGEVKNGETLDVAADSGEHVVQLKLDWTRSPKVSVSVSDGGITALGAKARPMEGSLTMLRQALFHAEEYILLWAEPEGGQGPDQSSHPRSDQASNLQHGGTGQGLVVPSSSASWAGGGGKVGDAFRAGFDGLSRAWLTWIAIALVTSAVAASIYFIAVAGNDVAFSYSFWSDGAPTSAAHTAAVATDWFVLAEAAGACTVGNTWMCRFALGGRSILGSLCDGVAEALRVCWMAIPLFVIGLAGAATVVLAPVVVVLLSPLPLARLDPAGSRDGSLEFIRRSVRSLSSIGCVVALGILGCWMGGTRVERAVASLHGTAQTVSGAAAVVLLIILVALIAGWCISAVCWVWRQRAGLSRRNTVGAEGLEPPTTAL